MELELLTHDVSAIFHANVARTKLKELHEQQPEQEHPPHWLVRVTKHLWLALFRRQELTHEVAPNQHHHQQRPQVL